ncbi:hypothetical protein [Moorena producens]|uniref:hypothetical protein n=1 Tax=Moorena producens TaxID=1155739 RepID=UPI0011EA696D|nr:hypothetical protein [Moorena producens]
MGSAYKSYDKLLNRSQALPTLRFYDSFYLICCWSAVPIKAIPSLEFSRKHCPPYDSSYLFLITGLVLTSSAIASS